MSSLSGSEKQSLKKLNETTPYVMKLTKKSIPTLKLLKKGLGGEYTTDNFPFKEFNKFDKDMEKVNKKLVKMAEKKMKSMNVKPYKVMERAKIYEKRENKIYNKIATNRVKLPKTLGGYTQPIAKKEDAKKDEKTVAVIGKNKPKKKGIKSLYKDVSGKVSSFMKKKFKIGENIHAEDKNIFKAISNRYQRKISSLDQKAIYSAMSVSSDDFKKYIQGINKNLY